MQRSPSLLTNGFGQMRDYTKRRKIWLIKAIPQLGAVGQFTGSAIELMGDAASYTTGVLDDGLATFQELSRVGVVGSESISAALFRQPLMCNQAMASLIRLIAKFCKIEDESKLLCNISWVLQYYKNMLFTYYCSLRRAQKNHADSWFTPHVTWRRR